MAAYRPVYLFINFILLTSAQHSDTQVHFSLTGARLSHRKVNFSLAGARHSEPQVNFSLAGARHSEPQVNFSLTGVQQSDRQVNSSLTGVQQSDRQVNFSLTGVQQSARLVNFPSAGAQQSDPQVVVVNFNDTRLTNGSTFHVTAAPYTNTNHLSVLCGVGGGRTDVSNVTLTCRFKDGHSHESTLPAPSGRFDLDVFGTTAAACQCNVKDVLKMIVGSTTFYLNFTVQDYVPRQQPFVKYGDLTLADGGQLRVNLDLLSEKRIKVRCHVFDGYPRVVNVTLACRGSSPVTIGHTYNAEFFLTVTQQTDVLKCFCTAGHETGLYRMTSSFAINVTYVPTAEPVLYMGDTKTQNRGSYTHFANNSVIVFECSVPGGKPEVSNITFTFHFSEGPRVMTSPGSVAGFRASVPGVGHARFECTAAHVTGLYNKHTVISVSYNVLRHVPQLYPEVKYQGQWVDGGGNITAVWKMFSPILIQCFVFGGYPSVSQIILTCGSLRQVIYNHTAVFELNNAPSLDGQRCVVSAQHVTGQYHKTTSFTLHVLYQSSVVKMVANGRADLILVPSGDSVTIECEADGNPKPQMFLYGRTNGSKAFGGPVTVNGTRLSRTFTATAGLEDIYVCMADNGVDLDPFYVGERQVKVMLGHPGSETTTARTSTRTGVKTTPGVGSTMANLINSFTVNGRTSLDVFPTQSMAFLCESTPSSAPHLSMTSMNNGLNVVAGPYTRPPNGISKTLTASRSDGGTYECRAEDAYGQILDVKRVTVLIKTSNLPIVLWQDTHVGDGQAVRVPVTASGQSKEIKQKFVCIAPKSNFFETIELTCDLSLGQYSSSANGDIGHFTLTATYVGHPISCSCRDSASRTVSTFLVSSQAKINTRPLTTLVTIVGVILATTLSGQFI